MQNLQTDYAWTDDIHRGMEFFLLIFKILDIISDLKMY